MGSQTENLDLNGQTLTSSDIWKCYPQKNLYFLPGLLCPHSPCQPGQHQQKRTSVIVTEAMASTTRSIKQMQRNPGSRTLLQISHHPQMYHQHIILKFRI